MNVEEPDPDVLEQRRPAVTDDDSGWDDTPGLPLEADWADAVEQRHTVAAEDPEWDTDRIQSLVLGVARAGDLGLLTAADVDWIATQAPAMGPDAADQGGHEG